MLEAGAIGLAVVSYSAIVFDRDVDLPFLYVSIGTVILLGVAALVSKAGTAFKALLFNVAFFALAVGIAEAFFGGWFALGGRGAAMKYEGEFFGRHGGGYLVPDTVRGYAAEPNVEARHTVWAGDEKVVDVVYTTNRHGLRISPHDVGTTPSAAESTKVVFFGCSLTVGEGVADRETMPWVFETLSEGRFRSYNFGFHGYGPHQMLRILETGLIDEVAQGKPPARAVYQGLIEHIERAAGNYPAISWGPTVPRYALREDGSVEYRGPFYGSYGQAFSVLNRSQIFGKVAPALLGWRRTPQDVALYIAIVRRSKELFEARYGGKFSVVMWGAYDQDYALVVDRLRQAQIEVFEVHKIIPDIYTADRKYKLARDEHPNATAHALIAKFLLEAL